MLKLADTSLILINPSPSNVKEYSLEQKHTLRNFYSADFKFFLADFQAQFQATSMEYQLKSIDKFLFFSKINAKSALGRQLPFVGFSYFFYWHDFVIAVHILFFADLCLLLCFFILHGSYKWIIMHEKCGRPDSNKFQLKWRFGIHKNWKSFCRSLQECLVYLPKLANFFCHCSLLPPGLFNSYCLLSSNISSVVGF